MVAKWLKVLISYGAELLSPYAEVSLESSLRIRIVLR